MDILEEMDIFEKIKQMEMELEECRRKVTILAIIKLMEELYEIYELYFLSPLICSFIFDTEKYCYWDLLTGKSP